MKIDIEQDSHATPDNVLLSMLGNLLELKRGTDKYFLYRVLFQNFDMMIKVS